MLLVEAFFKFGAIALLVALALLIIRDARNISTFRYGLLLVVSLICMFLGSGSEALRVTGSLAVPIRLIELLNTVFIWWFGLALFDDDFELGVREWLVAAAYVLVGLPSRLHYLGFDTYWVPAMDVIMAVAGVLMMSHLAYSALIGRKEDLVEKRRRVRILFAAAVALVLTASILAERFTVAIQSDSSWTIWITYICTLPLCLWALLWLTRLHPEALAFQSKPALAPQQASIDPRDIEPHAKLVSLMENQRAFTEHGLTIGTLAQKVAIPEHQLRVLINRSMGYQNFSAFLNHYRIDHVKRALTDPKNSRIPVLTLAMDAGFSSLAPFNRAFKSSVGVTPTEFRQNLLDKTINKAG